MRLDEVAESWQRFPCNRVKSIELRYNIQNDGRYTKERVWQAAADSWGIRLRSRKRKQISDPPEKKESLHILAV